MVKNREAIEATLARLLFLKSKVSELKLQVEALKGRKSGRIDQILQCSYCSRLIRKGTEITITSPSGEIKRAFHEHCFRAVLSS
jgi:hypothetical protein